MIVAGPGLVSEYEVVQVPFDSVQTVWPKLPVLLFVVQVIVPVGSDPDTIAVHWIGEKGSIRPGLGPQLTAVEDEVWPNTFVGLMIAIDANKHVLSRTIINSKSCLTTLVLPVRATLPLSIYLRNLLSFA